MSSSSSSEIVYFFCDLLRRDGVAFLEEDDDWFDVPGLLLILNFIFTLLDSSSEGSSSSVK